MTAADPTAEQVVWDDFYAESDALWSGDPNHALVVEVSDLAPGSALDVGCGEGADAVWLAERGWAVTALDVSEVALERARRAADRAAVEVTWVRAGLGEAVLPASGFDLVSACYPALPLADPRDLVEVLTSAVAPGGVLLALFHALPPEGPDHARARTATGTGTGTGTDMGTDMGTTKALTTTPRRPRGASTPTTSCRRPRSWQRSARVGSSSSTRSGRARSGAAPAPYTLPTS